jgi:signal transduction histidine kinase
MPLAPHRSARAAAWLMGAWLLCGLTVVALAAQAVFLVVAGVPLLSAEALEDTFPIIPVALVLGAVLGVLVVGRHPTHRVGWLLLLGQAGAAVGLAAQSLARAAATPGTGLPERLGEVAALLGHLFGATYALAVLGLLFLLVPDGHLPSRRWLPVGVLVAGGFVVAGVGLLLTPLAQHDAAGGAAPGGPSVLLVLAGQVAVALGLAGGTVAFVVRLNRSRGEERQQLRWIVAAATVLVVAVGAVVVSGFARGEAGPSLLAQVSLYVGYLLVLVATGVAVLRHRLYDIDLIIGRAVRLGALAGFVTAGYVAAVVSLVWIAGPSTSRVWPSLAAYALVAVAFQPLRRRVDRLADRVVYGARSRPYDDLAELTRQLAAAGRSEEEVLTILARSGALAAGARAARATLVLGTGGEVHEDWPPPPVPPGEERGREGEGRASPPSGGWDVRVPVTLRGEVLGSIDLRLQPGDRLTRARRRLLRQLAAQATLAVRNLRLTGALRARAEELTRQGADLSASRRRLLRAADDERERVAAAIRDDVAVHLDPLRAELDELAAEVLRHPDEAATRVDGLQQRVTAAIDALRTITAGILPPLLARRGLVAAVEAVAGRSPGSCSVAVAPGLGTRRLPPSVEAAAYLWCVRAMEVLRPDIRVSIDADSDRLLLTVRGRAQGRHDDVGAARVDRQHVLDRLDALGAQVDEPDAREGAAEWRAVVPLEPSAQAADSRSGPNADLAM